MKAEIRPVTKDALGIIAKKTRDYGFPRGVRWIERLLFDPNVKEGEGDPIRGAYVVGENGECVGMYCWFPCVVYHKQTRISACSGALLGVDRKYSTYIFDLVDLAVAAGGGRFSFGNDCASVAASKFWTGYLHCNWGPEEGVFTDARERKTLRYLCGLLRHLHLENQWAQSLLFCAAWPFLLTVNIVMKCFRRKDKEIRIVREPGFSDERFAPFWKKFLAANKGVVSSREPATLRWKFDEVIQKGIDILLAAEKGGEVIGYVLLRKMPIRGSLMTEYLICDICAIGDDEHVLSVLLKAAVDYFYDHLGVWIKYVGSPKSKKRWMNALLTRHFHLDCNPFSYSGGGDVLLESVKANEGWFFGPYDGERCMGYGGHLED